MTETPVVLLVDNGSTRPAATLSLRRIAADLSDAAASVVHPVSLQHADRIPAAQLGDQPAAVLPAFLRTQLEQGQRAFVVVPLFFGRSRALTAYIPQQVERLAAEYGAFTLHQADELAPLPAGEPRLAQILADQVERCSSRLAGPPNHVIVVDHGSPLPAVTAVRDRVASDLRGLLPTAVGLSQAVMERRTGAEYDFNGRLLAEALDACARAGGVVRVVLAMLFVSPGRHAGEGGDIEEIAAAAASRNPGLEAVVSGLVGTHPLLVDILRDRLRSALDRF